MQLSDNYPSSKSPKQSNVIHRYDYIDALRGIAIIGVLLAHISHDGNVAYPSWLQLITAIDIGPRVGYSYFMLLVHSHSVYHSAREKILKNMS